MRNPDRIEPIIDALRKKWELSPDLRLTQLVYNVARGARPLPPCPALFYLEDDAFLASLEEDQ